jgi:hypothetical protein
MFEDSVVVLECVIYGCFCRKLITDDIKNSEIDEILVYLEEIFTCCEIRPYKIEAYRGDGAEYKRTFIIEYRRTKERTTMVRHQYQSPTFLNLASNVPLMLDHCRPFFTTYRSDRLGIEVCLKLIIVIFFLSVL